MNFRQPYDIVKGENRNRHDPKGPLVILQALRTLLNIFLFRTITLKAPITTAADDTFCDIFPNFRRIIRSASRRFLWNMSDNSNQISYLICYFRTSSKICNNHLRQITGSALWVDGILMHMKSVFARKHLIQASIMIYSIVLRNHDWFRCRKKICSRNLRQR